MTDREPGRKLAYVHELADAADEPLCLCVGTNEIWNVLPVSELKPWQPTSEEREQVNAFVALFIDSQGPMKF